jgi:cobalt-zinc-cadmium efflux system outer membrane protein
MNIRSIAMLLLVPGALVSSASAQNPPSQAPSAQAFVDPVGGLSLDEAIRRGLGQEPSLRAERTTVDAARGMRQQADLRKNPVVSVERLEEIGGADNQTMINVEWPLDLFRRSGRIAVADREVAVAESAVADRERLLAADVRSRYGDVLVTVRELTVLDELMTTVRRQHEIRRARVEQGSSPALERDLIEVELRRLEVDRQLQLGRAESAMLELKRLLGIPPAEMLRLRDTLEDIVIRQSQAEPKGSSPQVPRGGQPQDVTLDRADVRAAEARIALADAKVDRAKRDGKFDVSIVGGYTRMDSSFPQLGVTAAGAFEPIHGVFDFVGVGAMVTVPLFARNQGDVAAARAERAGAAANLEAARLTAQTEIAAARARDQRAHEAVRGYDAGVRTLARRNLTVIEQSYELGRNTVFDVMAEQKRYLELERAYTETLRAAYEARTALERALGDMP